jgi:hypothetical protein
MRVALQVDEADHVGLALRRYLCACNLLPITVLPTDDVNLSELRVSHLEYLDMFYKRS